MNTFIRFVILLEEVNGFQTTKELVVEHVLFLQNLEDRRQLILCGPFKDHRGGMIVIKADSFKAAEEIMNSDPFVRSGSRRATLRTLELSCKENNHLGILE